MTDLPGNRIPKQALPPEGTSTPAEDAEFPPVVCRHGVSWSWVADEGGWICDWPDHHQGEAAVDLGAIDARHQPTYRSREAWEHPAIQAFLAEEDARMEATALQERVRKLMGR